MVIISFSCGTTSFLWENRSPLRQQSPLSNLDAWGIQNWQKLKKKFKLFSLSLLRIVFFWSKILLIIIDEFFWSKIATHPWWIFLEHYRSYIYCNCSSVDVDEKVPHLMFCGCWWESNMILRAKFKTGVLQSFFLRILVRSTKVKSKKHWNVWNTVKPL